MNSYLRFIGEPIRFPSASSNRCSTRSASGRVSGRAVVDLDAVRKQKQRGWLDPMGYLTGRLPVTAAGVLTTKDGKGSSSSSRPRSPA